MGRLIKQYSHYPELIGNDANKPMCPQYHRMRYEYDELGRLISAVNPNSRTNLAYDESGRLIQETLISHLTQEGQHQAREHTLAHQYDELGNRIATTLPDGKVINQRIRYTYDSHGRVLYKTLEAVNNPDKASRTALQLQYNANNELEKSLRTQYQGNQIIKTQTVYHYDAFGRRIAKQSETRNLVKNKDQIRQINKTQYKHTHMLWDSDLPIQEYSDTHVYTTVYDQDSFKPVARLAWLRDDLPEVANDNIDSIDREQDSSVIQVYHYHNDQLGTPNELTDQKGEVVWLADFEAWGNTAKIVYNEIKIRWCSKKYAGIRRSHN